MLRPPLYDLHFLTHSSLIFTLASGINVLTLNENTEFLIDSLGLGDSLVLFPTGKRQEEMIFFSSLQLGFIFLAQPLAESSDPSSLGGRAQKTALGPITSAASLLYLHTHSHGLGAVPCALASASCIGHSWCARQWLICFLLCLLRWQ